MLASSVETHHRPARHGTPALAFAFGFMLGLSLFWQALPRHEVPDQPGALLAPAADLSLRPYAIPKDALRPEVTEALAVGPILMGTRAPAHILAPSTTSRGIVNMAAIAATEALTPRGGR